MLRLLQYSLLKKLLLHRLLSGYRRISAQHYYADFLQPRSSLLFLILPLRLSTLTITAFLLLDLIWRELCIHSILPPAQSMPMNIYVPYGSSVEPSICLSTSFFPVQRESASVHSYASDAWHGVCLSTAMHSHNADFPSRQVPLLQPMLEDSSRAYRADMDSSQTLYWNL